MFPDHSSYLLIPTCWLVPRSFKKKIKTDNKYSTGVFFKLKISFLDLSIKIWSPHKSKTGLLRAKQLIKGNPLTTRTRCKLLHFSIEFFCCLLSYLEIFFFFWKSICAEFEYDHKERNYYASLLICEHMCTCLCGGWGRRERGLCGVCVYGGVQLHVCTYVSTHLWRREDSLGAPSWSPFLSLWSSISPWTKAHRFLKGWQPATPSNPTVSASRPTMLRWEASLRPDQVCCVGVEIWTYVLGIVHQVLSKISFYLFSIENRLFSHTIYPV